MPTPKKLNVGLFYVFIGSIILGALLGIFIVLRGEWSSFEVRVILTTVVLACSSINGLACEAARSPSSQQPLPIAGLILTVLTACLFLIGIWSSTSSEQYWKFTVSFLILTLATTQICLVSIARLAARFRWVFILAFQVAYGMAIYLIYLICFEVDSEGAIKFAGVLAIVDAALVIIIPILHRISRADARNESIVSPLGEHSLAAIDAEIQSLQKRIVKLQAMRAQIDKSGPS